MPRPTALCGTVSVAEIGVDTPSCGVAGDPDGKVKTTNGKPNPTSRWWVPDARARDHVKYPTGWDARVGGHSQLSPLRVGLYYDLFEVTGPGTTLRA